MISFKLLVAILGIAFAFPEPDSKTISQRTPPPSVTTLLGKIEGSILVTRLGKPLYAFRGIRYAKAPIDELRFQVCSHTNKNVSWNVYKLSHYFFSN